MDTVFLLLPLALILGLAGLLGLIWALKRGQFEDMEGPAQRILFDDDQEMMPFTDLTPREQASRPKEDPSLQTEPPKSDGKASGP